MPSTILLTAEQVSLTTLFLNSLPGGLSHDVGSSSAISFAKSDLRDGVVDSPLRMKKLKGWDFCFYDNHHLPLFCTPPRSFSKRS